MTTYGGFLKALEAVKLTGEDLKGVDARTLSDLYNKQSDRIYISEEGLRGKVFYSDDLRTFYEAEILTGLDRIFTPQGDFFKTKAAAHVEVSANSTRYICIPFRPEQAEHYSIGCTGFMDEGLELIYTRAVGWGEFDTSMVGAKPLTVPATYTYGSAQGVPFSGSGDVFAINAVVPAGADVASHVFLVLKVTNPTTETKHIFISKAWCTDFRKHTFNYDRWIGGGLRKTIPAGETDSIDIVIEASRYKAPAFWYSPAFKVIQSDANSVINLKIKTHGIGASNVYTIKSWTGVTGLQSFQFAMLPRRPRVTITLEFDNSAGASDLVVGNMYQHGGPIEDPVENLPHYQDYQTANVTTTGTTYVTDKVYDLIVGAAYIERIELEGTLYGTAQVRIGRYIGEWAKVIKETTSLPVTIEDIGFVRYLDLTANSDGTNQSNVIMKVYARIYSSLILL